MTPTKKLPKQEALKIGMNYSASVYFTNIYSLTNHVNGAEYTKKQVLSGKKFRICINQRNQDIVHHISVFECASGFELSEEEEKHVGQECGAVYLPNYISRNCRSKLIVLWVCF